MSVKSFLRKETMLLCPQCVARTWRITRTNEWENEWMNKWSKRLYFPSNEVRRLIRMESMERSTQKRDKQRNGWLRDMSSFLITVNHRFSSSRKPSLRILSEWGLGRELAQTLRKDLPVVCFCSVLWTQPTPGQPLPGRDFWALCSFGMSLNHFHPCSRWLEEQSQIKSARRAEQRDGKLPLLPCKPNCRDGWVT